MPSTIPAAMASAISGPLLVKMHSFFFVGHALGPHKTENLPRHKLALRLYDEFSDYREVRYRQCGPNEATAHVRFGVPNWDSGRD